MSAPTRLREHPQERFAGPAHSIDLTIAAAALRAEPHAAVAGHRQIALYRQGPLTQVLFLFDAGGHLKEHRADGVVTIHVLSGRLSVRVADAAHELAAGQLVVLPPNTSHTVMAPVPAEMLLTVCREAKPS